MAATPDPCWFLHDGAAGHRRQASALASALAAAPRELALTCAAPWAWVAPRALPGAASAFGAAFRDALASPPALAIGAGRRAALATRLLRERGSRVVQVLHPRIDTRHWDLVVAPEHDGRDGANVITLRGSLNDVDDAWLAAARTSMPALAAASPPRLLLLLGGPTAAAPFDDGDLATLLDHATAWRRRHDGRLWIVGSRRTPATWAAHARTVGADLCWFHDGDGANPYAAALASADRIATTPDSANLLSEAAATTAPVFVASPARASGRLGRLVRSLIDDGRVRTADDHFDAFPVTPLRETARVAAEVRRRLGLAGA